MASKIITSVAAVLLAATLLTSGEIMALITPQFTSSFQGDSGKVLSGQPDCGWYNIHGYRLGSGFDLSDVYTNLDWDDSLSITTDLVEININAYRDRALDDSSLSQLDTILSQYRSARHSVILRVMYDWDGKADSTEPASLDQVYSHIDSLAPVINRYKDIIFVYQGVLLGNHAEMHSSKLLTDQAMKKIMTHLSSSLDSSIYLSVRTPAQRRYIVGSEEKISAFSGSLPSRLGLFNDGLFGSETDLGTYGETSIKNQKDPLAKGTRAEELAYQDQIARFVPNGGEAGGFSSYGEISNALNDMRQMHISYLSHDYSEQSIDRWKNSTITIDGRDYDGMTAIGLYLGYRPLVDSVGISRDGFLLRDLTIDVTLSNKGFAPIYRPATAYLTITSDDGSKTTLKTSLDRKAFATDGKCILHFATRLKSLNRGTHSVDLSIINDATGRPIQLANDGYSDASINLGSFEKK